MQVMGGVGGHHTAAEGRYLMLGNGFLLLNTLAMALYYLRCGPMLTNPSYMLVGCPVAPHAWPHAHLTRHDDMHCTRMHTWTTL